MRFHHHPTFKITGALLIALFFVTLIASMAVRSAYEDAPVVVAARVDFLTLCAVVGVVTLGILRAICARCSKCRGWMFFPFETDRNGQFMFRCDKCEIDWGTGLYRSRRVHQH